MIKTCSYHGNIHVQVCIIICSIAIVHVNYTIPVISHWSVVYASPLSLASAERVMDEWLELAVAGEREREGERNHI